jgi:Fe-S cluster assembly scaffold protein SufB
MREVHEEGALRADWSADLRQKAKDRLARATPEEAELISKSVPILQSRDKVDSMSSLPQDVKRTSEAVGVVEDETARSGTYFQMDTTALIRKTQVEGLEVMSLEDAFERIDVKPYYWRAVPVDKDGFTSAVELYGHGGYVIIAKKGANIELPVQTCLFMRTNDSLQAPHNIIIAEEGASLNIITGCTAMPEKAGTHVGVSEFYIKKGAKVTFTMIHSWTHEIHVRPRTGVMTEEGGTFISHYVNLNPLSSLQMYPIVRLNGSGAKTSISSLIVGFGKSKMDVGSEIVFNAPGTKGEIISKSVSTQESEIYARGRLTANTDDVRGHLECRGLIMDPRSKVYAIPELLGNAMDVELTHEASVGKLSADQIYYLMSKGFSNDEATSILVRGFMETKIEGIPPSLESMIESVTDMVAKKAAG